MIPNNTIKYILITIFFGVCFIGLSAQELPRQKIKTPLQISMPDLIITEFTVIQYGEKQDGYVKYPFQAKFKNAGDKDISDVFYCSILQKNPYGDQFFTTHNHYKINFPLSIDEEKTFNGTFTLQTGTVSNKTTQVKFFLDSGGEEEFPPQGMHIKESNEDNNYSAAVSITGGYAPHITAINPDNPINRIDTLRKSHATNQKVFISGTGFGKNQGNYTVVFRPAAGGAVVKMNIKSWHQGAVYFTIPMEVKSGIHKVSIVDKQTLQKKSNEIEVLVSRRAVAPWSHLVQFWNDLKDAFEIRLHTHGGGKQYLNESYLKIVGRPDTLDIDSIIFSKKAIGKYFYLIKDLKSQKGGISLSKYNWSGKRLDPNTLRMEIKFESEGKEAKGFFKSAAGGKWKDGGAPDIHINNGRLAIDFKFLFANSKFDYTVKAMYFDADIKAAKKIVDWLLNAFMRNWDDEVESKIYVAINKALNKSDTKESITDSFLDLLAHQCVGYKHDNTVTTQDIIFKDRTVEIIYH